MWEAFHYCETFAGRFNAEECERVIALHQGTAALQSRMPRGDGAFIRDSDLFWVPRTAETEWIFTRIWDVATLYNSRYGFELFAEMGQLQLTRYAKDQLYNWHMDLGAGAMSLRKISWSSNWRPADMRVAASRSSMARGPATGLPSAKETR
jgi:PKHD-type hydroxylase